MIDLDLFRARIGLYDSNVRSGPNKFNKSGVSRPRRMWMFLIFLSISLPLFISVGAVASSNVSHSFDHHLDLENNFKRSLHKLTSLESNIQPRFSSIFARNWNSTMKAINGNKTCINIAHWNGGSSHLAKSSKGREKLHHVKFLINKYNADVFGLSEANLHQSVNEYEYKIDKYKSFHQKSNMSRIVVYVREDLDCKIEEKLMDPDIACVWLLVGRGRSRWLIGQTYREHMILGDKDSSSNERQLERWRRYLDKVKLTENYENVIIIGDLNVNLDPDTSDNNPLQTVLRDELLDVFPLAGLKQTVRNNTRQIENQKASLLDQSWNSNMNKHVKTSNYDTDSDHDIIVTTLKTKGNVVHDEVIVKRNYSKFNREDYLLDLMSLRWTEVYDLKDPTLIDTFITDKLLSVLDKHAPIRTFKTGGIKNRNRNISKECLQSIRNRNKLRQIAKRTNSVDDWEKWRKTKNRVNNLLRDDAAKNVFKEQKIAEDDMTGRQIWNRVKRLAGWSTSLSPTIFSTDSGVISNPKQMADLMNKFFCDKVSKILF